MQAARESKKCRKIGPYVLLRPIGKGSYSTVFEARLENDTTQRFAVKQISLQNKNQKQLERMHKEINVLSLIKHENIVSMVDSKQTPHNLYLVFEHCKFTDLNVYAQTHHNGRLSEQKVRRIIMQLKGAFRVLRQHKIVHRDLKLGNILVTQNFQIKLADFGFANFLEDDQFFRSIVGTFLTMAPQVIQKKQYNQKCDIWSLGIITYQLLFGCNPFYKQEKMTFSQVRESLKKEVTFPEEISQDAQDLIKRMLVHNPEFRMSFQQFFKHPWLQEYGEISNLSQMLRSEALKYEITRSLNKSNKRSIQKQFILNNCQSILTYSLIEFLRMYFQNSLMTLVNIAKHVQQSECVNRRLIYCGLSILLDSIDETMHSPLKVMIDGKTLIVPCYGQFCKIQTWELSEYSKRLPNFVAKSINNIEEYLSASNYQFRNAKQTRHAQAQQFIAQLRKEIDLSSDKSSIKIFLKIKQWQGPQLQIGMQSTFLSEQALAILLRNLSLKLQYDELCKKCANMFKLMMVNRANRLQSELQQLRESLIYQQL